MDVVVTRHRCGSVRNGLFHRTSMPRPGMNVQTHLQKQVEAEPGSYESFLCPACLRLHHIDVSNGRVLGDDT
jgi:hypothetical protein